MYKTLPNVNNKNGAVPWRDKIWFSRENIWNVFKINNCKGDKWLEKIFYKKKLIIGTWKNKGCNLWEK